MPESDSNQHVTVTAGERAHPAITKLARACIALARQLSGSPSTELSPPAAVSGQSTSEKTARQERADD
jgi:hypothetical protein